MYKNSIFITISLYIKIILMKNFKTNIHTYLNNIRNNIHDIGNKI